MTRVSAQKWPKGSHNVPVSFTYYSEWPIECNGVLDDLLTGELSVHLSQFCIPTPEGDVTVWGIEKFSGTLTSTSGSGEVFEVQEVDKYNRPLSTAESWTWHGIYKGNQGHRYNVWGHFDTSTTPWKWYIDKSICH